MQSTATTVSAFMKEIPADRLAVCKKLRALFKAELKGYKEVMQYGGPCYAKNGFIEAGWMSQKNHIGVCFLKNQITAAYKEDLKGVSVGKGVVRFNPKKVNFEIVQQMLRDCYEREDFELQRVPVKATVKSKSKSK